MGNFIDKDNLKTAMDITDSDKDDFLDELADAVESLWDEKTDKTWFQGVRTEYYDSEAYKNKIFLLNYPVATSPVVQIWDDPDWGWPDSSKIDSTDFRVDYRKGIVHYNGYFYEGSQSIKVVYTAGYTAESVPNWLKRILIRQACHWYKQESEQRWDKSSVAAPAGGGTVAYKNLIKNLLPEFVELAEANCD